MNLLKHKIKIDNFTNLEIIAYPLIIVKGTVETAGTSCQNDDDKLFFITSHKKYETKIIDNKFKILIQLLEGENNLVIKHCCEEISFKLIYTPKLTKFSVIPIYIICAGHDGRFQAPSEENNSMESALKRIMLGTRLIQSVIGEKLYEQNLGRKTFYVDESDCQIFRSKLDVESARKMKPQELWEYFGREIMTSSIGREEKKYVGFISCTRYNGDRYDPDKNMHDDLLKITEAHAALGGGGLALFGTGCLYTWPENFDQIIHKFEDITPVDRTQFFDDSCYRGTSGACFSTTLGAVLHELCHAFDLGHTESGIMGRGFDNIHKVFTSIEGVSANNISKTFQSNIEFKEEFEADKLSERLLNENKKKEFNVIKKFDDVDDTYFSKSCAVFLSYHKWFIDENIAVQKSHLHTTERSVKSTSGIRVVEIRNVEDDLVLFSWTFEGRVLKFEVTLPEELFTQNNKKTKIIFEDSQGNIMKGFIHL